MNKKDKRRKEEEDDDDDKNVVYCFLFRSVAFVCAYLK